jgi:hypothetical protein
MQVRQQRAELELASRQLQAELAILTYQVHRVKAEDQELAQKVRARERRLRLP